MLSIAFALSAVMTLLHQVIMEWFPLAQDVGHVLGLYRLVPAFTLFFTFYALFYALTPSRYRTLGCRKWPGALLVTAWWLGTVELIAPVLSLFGGYTRTYGSLAGVMIALIFFFVVGLGVVIGAELNAALAESGATALKGEVYTGPYSDELEVEEPQPGEDVEPVLQTGGQQL
jgi:membrane protein